MKNEEIKKKIVEILCKVWIETVPFTAERKFEHAAEALIAAGIGDVSKWKAYAKVHRIVITKDDKIKQLYSDEEVDKIVIERAEYKHRAEVAERALREFAVQISCRNCPFLKRCDTVPDAMDDYQGCFDMYLKQSEKDLAEEKK